MVAKKKTAKKKKRTIKHHPGKGTIPRSKVKKAVAKVFEQAAKKKKTVLAWHFMNRDMRLNHQDDRKAVDGKWLSVTGHLSECRNGLHASRKIWDALDYAAFLIDYGCVLCRVRLEGKIIEGSDKLCARKRKVIWHINAKDVLIAYAIKMGAKKSAAKSRPISAAATCKQNGKLLLKMIYAAKKKADKEAEKAKKKRSTYLK